MSPVLAETVSFTEEEILVILLVLLGMLLAAVVFVALGCVWAWKAGRGSQLALAGAITIVSFEAMAFLAALPSVLSGDFFVVVPAGALALQAILYFVAKDKERAGR
jgi:hypothetical protein